MISRGYVDHCFMLCNHAPPKSKANEKEFVKKSTFQRLDLYLHSTHTQFVISHNFSCAKFWASFEICANPLENQNDEAKLLGVFRFE